MPFGQANRRGSREASGRVSCSPGSHIIVAMPIRLRLERQPFSGILSGRGEDWHQDPPPGWLSISDDDEHLG